MIIIPAVKDLLEEEIKQGYNFEDNELFIKAQKISVNTTYSIEGIISSFNLLKSTYYYLRNFQDEQERIKKELEEKEKLKEFIDKFHLNIKIQKDLLVNCFTNLGNNFKKLQEIPKFKAFNFFENESLLSRKPFCFNEITKVLKFNITKESEIIKIIQMKPWYFLKNSRTKIFSSGSSFYYKSFLFQKNSSIQNVCRKVIRDFRFYYFCFGV